MRGLRISRVLIFPSSLLDFRYGRQSSLYESTLMFASYQVWVDTCCIDKKHLVELSEAINSMYLWYYNSSACYAYLSDVPNSADNTLKLFRKSEWFTRGWTLQELIAPKSVEFYAKDWERFGTRLDLHEEISQITGISASVLCGESYHDCSVAQKMSWAAKRFTTKPEDLAYCLMGIFNIHMATEYGEGTAKAFHRLQEQIMNKTEDHTLFIWKHLESSIENCGLLSTYPRAFRFYFEDTLDVSHLTRRCHPGSSTDSHPPKLDSRGIRIYLRLAKIRGEVVGLLDVEHAPTKRRVCVLLEAHPEDPMYYKRKPRNVFLAFVPEADIFSTCTIYIHYAAPKILDFSPLIPMESHLIISTKSSLVQLQSCLQYGLGKRETCTTCPNWNIVFPWIPQHRHAYPPMLIKSVYTLMILFSPIINSIPCVQHFYGPLQIVSSSSRQREWIQPLWASPSDVGITHALLFTLSDESGQSFEHFSVQVGMNDSLLPWCEIQAVMEENENRICGWDNQGLDSTKKSLMKNRVGPVDRALKRLSSGRQVSAIVRCRNYLADDPPIPEVERILEPIFHCYVYTLHITITSPPVTGRVPTPHHTSVMTRYGRVPEHDCLLLDYLLLGISSQFSDSKSNDNEPTISELADAPLILLPSDRTGPYPWTFTQTQQILIAGWEILESEQAGLSIMDRILIVFTNICASLFITTTCFYYFLSFSFSLFFHSCSVFFRFLVTDIEK